MFSKWKRAAQGAHVPHVKSTADLTTVKMQLPAKIVLPMQQHIGAPCTPVVSKGEEVKVGTVVGKSNGFVSADIHSSVSGVVQSIDELMMPNGAKVQAVTIIPDGMQTIDPACKPPVITDAASLVQAVRDCGLVGLGGAGFPTAVKLSVKEDAKIDTLLINGAECEPYITSDNREFLECSDTIMRGVQAVKEHLKIKKVIFGIERNKPQAIDLMLSLTKADSDYEVKPLKTRYPQGAEKVFIEQVTNREVPRGGLPSDVGVIVMNVTTVSMLGKFMESGVPLVTKRLTIDGDAVHEPKNVEVLIGTPIQEVFDFCAGLKEDVEKVLMGGPMMGIAVPNLEIPVVKQNNALLAFSSKKAHLLASTDCIRCGRCIEACPVGLSPVEIADAYQAHALQRLDDMMVDLCMNCGSCTFVCPAKLPVAQTMFLAKTMQKERGTKK